MKFGIGQSVTRLEDPALITGRGRFTSDLRPDGTAWMAVVRSPFGHADFAFGDLEAVRAMPGVIGVLTAADIPGLGPIPCMARITDSSGEPIHVPEHPVLPASRVRHVGEAVAIVVARTAEAARDAAEAVEIDWRDLPAVASMSEALADGAPVIWPAHGTNEAYDWRHGDPDAVARAFADAAHVVSLDLVNNRIVTNYLETRSATGSYDADSGRYTLVTGTQGVHIILPVIADQIFNLPRERFHFITPDVGGGFGTRFFPYREYVLVMAAAERFGCPVTWVGDRTEHFLADYHGRGHESRAELALDADGRFLALKVDTKAEMGAYISHYAAFVPVNGTHMVPGAYAIPAVDLRVRGVFTNTVCIDAYRGAGRPEAAYLIERLVDKAARELGLSQAEIRRLNFVPPNAMPHTTQTARTYDSGEFDGHMTRAMEAADWAGFPARRAESEARGRLRGIGMATYIEACAGGGPETATLSVEPDGSVKLLIGSQASGQGHKTAYAQIVAERLGIAPDLVEVIQGDSDLVKTGAGTGGSRSIPVGGVSVSTAGSRLAERVRQLASDMLEAAPDDIALQDGEIRIAGTDRATTFRAVAARAAEMGQPLAEAESWGPEAPTYPNGTHVVEVEIDPDTGETKIVGYTVVDDFGATLNPLLLEGQVHGGIAQGVGQALMEQVVYEAGTGQLVTASFQDYQLPRAEDFPDIGFETRNVPCKTNPLGFKGAGEAGAIGACPAVVNAVVDALHAYAGIAEIDMPITPMKLWRALREGKQAAE
ncbi:xanthine dehydrogenase family protein molybdopterin-binding subunit [Lutibaculum baratangense]|uniref:Putative hypoxanthine oxidase XdhD n=1 Tax=Lutibaculum baratangense AMV1 TaxID=631454 RepID=V4RHT4_9HYPH|nr:xanthine dehydrogenase family protein molybdopterin-binding subunit [Lutibaculum baratangense]ESR25691.1 putative hypoxanthine oxidase XdhD [Lutibaculum baratangense AMV1]